MQEAVEFSVYLHYNCWRIIATDTARNLDTQEIKELKELYEDFKIHRKLEYSASS